MNNLSKVFIFYLLYFGVTGTWAAWGGFVQFILWGSAAATALITLGLFVYGIRGKEPILA